MFSFNIAIVMISSDSPLPVSSTFALSLRGDVVRRSVRFALIVGTILMLINHGHALLALEIDKARVGRILLTYAVPYVVTTLASVQAIRREEVQSP